MLLTPWQLQENSLDPYQPIGKLNRDLCARPSDSHHRHSVASVIDQRDEKLAIDYSRSVRAWRRALSNVKHSYPIFAKLISAGSLGEADKLPMRAKCPSVARTTTILWDEGSKYHNRIETENHLECFPKHVEQR